MVGYYGGPLLSTDGRTRFEPRDFKRVVEETNVNPVPFPLFGANSLGEVRDFVKDIQRQYSPQMLAYRGQQNHYKLNRKVSNPFFDHPDLGETSLLPSVWRYLVENAPQQFSQFEGLSVLEWSSILYQLWPLEEIKKREEALAIAGEYLSVSYTHLTLPTICSV